MVKYFNSLPFIAFHTILKCLKGYDPAFGGNLTTPIIAYSMKIAAQNVQNVLVPNSGHWIQEEQPVRLVKLLSNFFSGNSATRTSK